MSPAETVMTVSPASRASSLASSACGSESVIPQTEAPCSRAASAGRDGE